MGAYVYRLGAPSRRFAALLDGKTVTVGTVQFAYKPSWSDERWNRLMHNQYVTLPCAGWRRVLDGTPPYVAVVHADEQPNDGDLVLRWPQGRFSVTDDPNWGGLAVGKLALIGVHHHIIRKEKKCA